jgi:hypothetical protein
MKKWKEIRFEVLREEKSKREILRREKIHWETLKKILENPEPPGYWLTQPRLKPKLGPYLERIAQIIEEDSALPKTQRHTAKRIVDISDLSKQGKFWKLLSQRLCRKTDKNYQLSHRRKEGS